jgi:two-component system, OmpR family, response regulator
MLAWRVCRRRASTRIAARKTLRKPHPTKPAVRILLVEDDPALADTTSRALKAQGWSVDWCTRGEPVAQSLRQDPYDLVLLDIGLAGIDGFETLRRLRAQGSTTPVLMLTARDAIEDRVRGLEAGADDYLVKPFHISELVARARVLHRRTQARQDDTLALGRLRMDLAAKRLFSGAEELEVSAREWAVLAYLLARAGKVVSKDQILQGIAGWDENLSANAVEVYVSRLRAKIEPAGVRIRTVRGFGYLLQDDTPHGAEP